MLSGLNPSGTPCLKYASLTTDSAIVCRTGFLFVTMNQQSYFAHSAAVSKTIFKLARDPAAATVVIAHEPVLQ